MANAQPDRDRPNERRRLGFGGEVARLYEKYRRGYPTAVIHTIVDAFALDGRDTVIDLGCGTGQLTVPVARRVGWAVGVDPEADMLWLARGHPDRNITWRLGSGENLPEIAQRAAPQPIGAVTVAVALHWMDDVAVFGTAHDSVRPGGGVAVVTNGKPLWQVDTGWAAELRAFLERHRGRAADQHCGTDDESQQRYRTHLASAGFAVTERHVRYDDDLDFDRLYGMVLSAHSLAMLPRGDDRARFRDALHDALGDGPFPETVDVSVILGRRD
ncbi:MAG TPA: methyltransferase domain-containing protein [Micromonosporaceae bacterium]|nr:methyltransferase domain-containing protein [Micromonosporaceae bacterium]